MSEKKAAVLLADGYEEGESLFVVDIFRRCGVAADTVSIEGEMVFMNFLFLSYVPLSKKSNRTLLSFEAHTSLFTGSPVLDA